MPKVTITIEQKRPRDATPDRARQMKAAGMSVAEIARAWGVSRSIVYRLLKR